MKKHILIFISLLSLTYNAKAQDGFENIFLADAKDANKLIEAYFTPAMEGFIYGMNNGWYHTAKVHKVLGFDLTVGLNAVMAPSSKEMFNISSLGLTSVTSSSTSASTFTGSNSTTTFTASRNVTINDPSSPANGGKTSVYGIGLKKEITSWFGPLDKLPLHVSVLAAYTSMNLNYGFANQTTGALQMNNASADFELRAYTVQAIASLNFPVINVYGGIGYGSGSSKFKMKGTYIGEFNYTEAGQKFYHSETLTTPDMEFDVSGIKTTIGARFSVLFFKIFADYTLQEYNTFNAGIAFSIR